VVRIHVGEPNSIELIPVFTHTDTAVYSGSIPQSCYKRAAWVQNWNQFWKLLAARHQGAEESAWFAMFDFANFYDCVDLRRLETTVRAIVMEPIFT
jgi:hypothetical protein